MNKTFKIICIFLCFCRWCRWCYSFALSNMHSGCSSSSYTAWYNGEHEMSLYINQIDSRAFVVRAQGNIIHLLCCRALLGTAFLFHFQHDSNRLRAMKIEVFVSCPFFFKLCKFVRSWVFFFLSQVIYHNFSVCMCHRNFTSTTLASQLNDRKLEQYDFW